MPNIKISDLPNVTLPLDAANVFLEVQAIEAGIEVSRKIAADALSGAFGLDATFVTVTANAILPNERILTAGSGIDIVDGGAGNPITISVTSGGNPFDTPLGILGDINTATPPTTEAITNLLEFRDAQDVNLIGSIGYNAQNELLIQNEMRGGTTKIKSMATSGVFFTAFEHRPDTFTFLGSPGTLAGDGKTLFLTTGDGQPGFEGGDMIIEAGRGGGTGLPGRIQIEQGNLFIAEHAAAIIDNAGYGQFWVRDDVPNVPMFTDDVGTDFVLNASGINISGTPVDNQIAIWTNANTLEGDAALTWDGNTLTLSNFPSGIIIEDGGFLRLIADGAPDNASFQVDINSELVTTFSAGVSVWLISGGRDIRIGDSTFSDYFQMQHDGSFINFSAVQTDGLKIDDITLFLEERVAAAADVATYGQFWVRDDVPNTPMFTDDVGTDFELNAAASIPDPLIIGSVNMTSADSAGDTGSPYDNVPINVGANLVGTMPMTQISRQRIQTKSSSLSFNATLFINTGGAGTAGSDTIIGSLNGAQIDVDFGQQVTMKHGTSGTNIFSTIDTGILLPEGSVFIDEKAAAEANVSARGEFWVRNDAPNTPMFTNDLGTDFVLNASPSFTPPLVLLDNEEIQFGTGTDVTMEWNGTEFDLSFAAAASIMRLRDGAQLRFMSPNDVDSTFIQQLADRTNILSSGAGAGFWQFQPELRIINDLTFGSAGALVITESGGDMRIDLGTLGDLRIRGGTAGVEIMAEFTANAGVALYHNNARRFETIAIQVDGAISGAVLDDADGNMLHIGFQEQIWILQNTVLGTTDNVWRDAAGHILYSDDAGTETYTTPAAADAVVPDGYWVDIVNLGAGAITVAEGVGVTLTHIDGAGATGSLVIAQFGKMRLHKRIGAAWFATNTVDVS